MALTAISGSCKVGSVENKLDKLADLRDKDILTKEEYRAKKQQLTG